MQVKRLAIRGAKLRGRREPVDQAGLTPVVRRAQAVQQLDGRHRIPVQG